MIKEVTLIQGTLSEIQQYFAVRMLSREHADQRFNKIYQDTAIGIPVRLHPYSAAFEIPNNSIQSQLEKMIINNALKGPTGTIVGFCSPVFFMAYTGFTRRDVSEKAIPQIEISLESQFVLIRPDNWLERAKAQL